MSRQALVTGLLAPAYLSETGTRQAALSGTFINETAQGASYTLSCDVGAVTLSGEAVTLTITGPPPVVRHAMLAGWPHPVFINENASRQAQIGSSFVNETLQSVVKVLSANVGIFTLSGQAATFLTGDRLTASAADYTFSGQTVTLKAGRRLASDVGVFTYDIASVVLAASQEVISPGVGVFALTGNAASLIYTPTTNKLIAAGGEFALTGNAAGLAWDVPFPAAAGTFTFAGQAASFLRPYRITVEVGAFVATVPVVTLTAPQLIAYPLTGRTITI